MGKGHKQRLYMTSNEWKDAYGGHKPKQQVTYRALPFDRCAVSLQPFVNPVCTLEGHVFDLESIVPYIKEHHMNPCTGRPLAVKDLIKLTFHKNTNGEYCCPITYKVFNNNTNIVAVATSGNVYAKQAVDELNIKQKVWLDLVSGEKFKRSDIITLQDPQDVTLRSLDGFKHLKERGKNAQKRKHATAESSDSGVRDGPRARQTTKHYTASFTSTAMTPRTRNERELLTPAQIRSQWHAHVKTLGDGAHAFVRMNTNLGYMDFVIRCDLVPRICHNFLELCKRKYYDGLVFHRLIPGFMIQGGDPLGTGTGGESAWGADDTPMVADEFHQNLRHDGRGVLSMANSGANTNKSQFFITFDECSHLDDKHSVFGRLVNGHDVLAAIERQPCTKKDRPSSDIRIESIAITRNPFDEKFEAKDELILDREAQKAHDMRVAYSKGQITRKQYHERKKNSNRDNNDDDGDDVGQWYSGAPLSSTASSSSAVVGKYLPAHANANNGSSQHRKKKKVKMSLPKVQLSTTVSKAKASASSGYGNFDNW